MEQGKAEIGKLRAENRAGQAFQLSSFSFQLSHALDRDARAVEAQRVRLQTDPPRAAVIPRQADVLRPLELPPLDGVLLANLLHFVRDQIGLLRRLHSTVRPGGALLVVEYEQAFPIPWVPHPLLFARLATLVTEAGFTPAVQIGTRRSPSSGRVLYAAVAHRPQEPV